MAGYTKEDFDNNYSIRIERYLPGGVDLSRPEVRVGYARCMMKQYLDERWDAVAPHLGLDATSIVVVVGAGFGWGVERLIEITGCTAVGLDISDYVHSVKDTNEIADLEERIVAAGLDLQSERAQEILSVYGDANPRCRVNVVNEDLMSVHSRNAVRNEIGNQLPTHVITEDMIQEFTDQEVLDWAAEAEKFGVEIIHIMSPGNSSMQTPQHIKDLTGHRVLLVVGAHITEL